MVSVTIVTWNSAKYLEECFAALAQQDYPEIEVIVVDNASEDDTRSLLQPVKSRWRVIYNNSNVGFAAGQNQAIRASQGKWVLCLNPDVVLSPNFVTELAKAGEAHPEVGSLCGKLLRWDESKRAISRPSELRDGQSEPSGSYQGTASAVPSSVQTNQGFSPCDPLPGLKPSLSVPDAARLNPSPDTKPEAADTLDAPNSELHTVSPAPDAPDPRRTSIIDSTGIYFIPSMRHLDRGAEEVDRGQYDRAQYVFGASGAAAFFRRDFVLDVSVDGEFFDEEFFSFREDGDLAWRAQVMGWKCLYVPTAIAWHVRRVTPERRKDLPLVINWHSAKNRFLMRGKNASGWLCRRLFFPVLWRDIMTFGYAIIRDRRLWSAVTYWWRARDSIRRKREIIQSRRRVSDHDLLWWFSNSPRAAELETEKGTGPRDEGTGTRD